MIEEIPTQIVDEAEIDFDDGMDVPIKKAEEKEGEVPTQIYAEEEVNFDDGLIFRYPDPLNILKISIGSIEFRLIETTDSIKDYETIRIVSFYLGKLFYFWCYRSHSELGMWRYGAVNPINQNEFFKGPDKVQHTLIHLELQQFINNNMQYMVLENRVPVDMLHEHNLRYSDGEPMFEDITKNEEYNFLLNSMRRQLIIEDPFNAINKQFQCGQKIFKDVTQVLNSCSERLKELYHATMDNNKIIIPNYTYKFENIFNVRGDIFEIILVSKIKENPDIKLYYLKSEFTECPGLTEYHLYPHISAICNQPYHIMPILLTLNEDINPLGVYKVYIPAGIYICKELDRSKSCKPHENAKYRVNSQYTYIGSRYENLFPYENLFGHIDPIQQEGLGININKRYRRQKLSKIKKKQKKQNYTKQTKISKKLLINIQTKKRLNTKLTKATKKIKKNKSKKYGIRTM